MIHVKYAATLILMNIFVINSFKKECDDSVMGVCSYSNKNLNENQAYYV